MKKVFEKLVVDYLEGEDYSLLSPQGRNLRSFFRKNPKGPMRRRILKQMESQADAIVQSDSTSFSGHYQDFGGPDWRRLIEILGPLIKLLLSLRE